MLCIWIIDVPFVRFQTCNIVITSNQWKVGTWFVKIQNLVCPTFNVFLPNLDLNYQSKLIFNFGAKNVPNVDCLASGVKSLISRNR